MAKQFCRRQETNRSDQVLRIIELKKTQFNRDIRKVHCGVRIVFLGDATKL